MNKDYLEYLELYHSKRKKQTCPMCDKPSKLNKYSTSANIFVIECPKCNQKITITKPVIISAFKYESFLDQEQERIFRELELLREEYIEYDSLTKDQKNIYERKKNKFEEIKKQIQEYQNLISLRKDKVKHLENKVKDLQEKLRLKYYEHKELYDDYKNIRELFTIHKIRTLVDHFKDTYNIPKKITYISKEVALDEKHVIIFYKWLNVLNDYIILQDKLQELEKDIEDKLKDTEKEIIIKPAQVKTEYFTGKKM